MLTLIAITFVFFCIFLKRKVGIYLGLYGLNLILFSIAVDGNSFGFWDHMYVHDEVVTSSLHIYYWAITALGFFIFFLVLENKSFRLSKPSYLWVHFGRVLAVISLAAAIFNFIRAGDPSLMLIAPRTWEVNFGRYVISNYLYFMHLPALVVLTSIIILRKPLFLDNILIVALVASSFLHGIKFTFIHAFVFLAAAIFLSRSEKIDFKKLAFLSGILFFSLLLFFTNVRGGGLYGFIDYVTSPAVNSMYLISNKNWYEFANFNIFNPFSVLPLEKLQSRLFNMQAVILPETARYWLNDKYNLQHSVTSLSFFWGVGFIFFSFLLSLMINCFRLSSFSVMIRIYLLCILISVIGFLFTTFHLYHTKLWFGFFVLIIGLISINILSSFSKKYYQKTEAT